ncbi:uncharacterized protein LOC135462116 [Liolophura sinensis]|uniref:uncharacterized protein LOC135462116 n=1 Tax=Liolophura sinensis TaxID=3198878 RepID=UPI0031596451
MGYFFSPLDVGTEQNFDDICSCRPTQESDGNSLWLEYKTPRVTDLDPRVIWVTIDQLTEDITYGFDFAFGNLISVIKPADSIADDLENAGNFLVATWRTTDTLPSIHIRDMTIREILHRPHFFFYLGSWIPILPLFVMVVLRGKKKRVNTHYVYSIKDVQKALAKGRRRFGHRKKNSTQRLKPKQENKNLAEGNSQPHPAFGHGDFSQTFKVINGKLVVEKLRRDLD